MFSRISQTWQLKFTKKHKVETVVGLVAFQTEKIKIKKERCVSSVFVCFPHTWVHCVAFFVCAYFDSDRIALQQTNKQTRYTQV